MKKERSENAQNIYAYANDKFIINIIENPFCEHRLWRDTSTFSYAMNLMNYWWIDTYVCVCSRTSSFSICWHWHDIVSPVLITDDISLFVVLLFLGHMLIVLYPFRHIVLCVFQFVSSHAEKHFIFSFCNSALISTSSKHWSNDKLSE